MSQPSPAILGAIAELDWLKNNPAFRERPASISEFLGPNYLNIDSGVRPGLRQVLIDIFGEHSNPHSLAKYQEAMMTGAIGIGKTTFASIALPYMAHWVLCLNDPQDYFNLLPGSRIAFMQMSTSEDQAREVIFGDIIARINHSPWFKKFPRDPNYKNQIRFVDKDIWIVPGDSAETTFEGYNILGGILDEMDSHRITPKKDYAQEGYNTISNRITSRFDDRGLFILIGQMKKDSGFAARHYERMKAESTAYVSRMTIWESFGWSKYLRPDGSRDSFWFDVRRKIEIPDIVANSIENEDFLEVPNAYRKAFMSNPVKALKDLAGIPQAVGNPFIGMLYKLDAARDKWHVRFGVDMSPVGDQVSNPQFAPWFMAKDGLRRAAHVDIAYAEHGDSVGIAMGHVRELKEVDDELRPYIVFDFLMRIRPLPGREITIADLRQILYKVRDDLGFNLRRVTFDGFQSTESIQQLRKRRFDADYLSVDRTLLAYEDFRDALYEERLEFPRYYVYADHGQDRRVEIAYEEIIKLVDTGKKVDHPPGGSKDVADAMAAVTSTLMGDRRYRRGVSSVTSQAPVQPGGTPEPVDLESLVAATSLPSSTGSRFPIPGHLIPRGDILDGLDSLRRL